jgi:two-component system, OmpR family, phosphate regulon response regulator OmpR
MLTASNANSQTGVRNSARRLVVVDDDERLRDLLSRYLTEQGFDVHVAQDAQSLYEIKRLAPVDLIILDLMMPGEDGMSVCRRLRAGGDDVPIIMLTAKVQDSSRIMGLDIGADDYIAKPFNPRELLSRIHAVLRRYTPREHPSAPSPQSETFRFGGFELNLSRRTLSRGSEDIPITSGEFAMLKVFARHPGEPLSRDRLMELARGREYEAFDRSLDVQISRLRKLIEPNPAKPVYIQTVWGLGYVFVPDGQP